MKLIILSAVLIFSMNLQAHEGAHGPALKMSPHGGVLKDDKSLMGELVQDPLGVKIYLLSHESKALSVADLKIDLKAIQLTDAKKKAVSFEIVSGVDSILLKFDISKSYRYNLILPISYDNFQNKLNWQFEPQSN